MLKKEIQHIRVGFFVFVALSVAMFMIFMIGSEKKFFESHYTLKCTFADISGLRIGAPVQLAGVSIGFVHNIRFPRDLMQKEIEVVLELAERYKERIREDSVATINTQGLLGDKYIFISIGSPDKPVLKDGDTLKAKEVVGLFALAEKGGEILGDLQEVAKHLSKFFADIDEEKGGVKGIVTSIRDILNEAEKGRGLIHALVYDPKGEDILKDLSASMASLRILLGETDKGEARRGRMKSIARNLSEVAANLNEITTRINRGEGTIGGLISDPALYNELRNLLGKANRNSLFRTVVRATLSENEKEALR